MATIVERRHHPVPRTQARRTVGVATLFAPLIVPGASEARRNAFCSETARLQYAACLNEEKDDRLALRAVCVNTEDDDDRADCLDEFKEARGEGNDECRTQHEARRDLCALLGGARYDPDFDPADFDTDFANPPNLNPYLPTRIGNFWAYAADGETNTVEVLPDTKLIEGVTCIVVRDLVKVGGVDLEDTDDWVVTFDFSPLDPEARERKFYAPGIGLFLEVDLTGGDINELVDCNVDPRCATLPAP